MMKKDQYLKYKIGINKKKHEMKRRKKFYILKIEKNNDRKMRRGC